MKKIIGLSCLVLAASLLSQAAMADDAVKIRAGMSSNNYTLVASDGTDWAKSTYRSVNVGLTVLISEAVYIDLSGSKGTGNYDRPLYAGVMDRTDYALVGGWNKVTESGKVFNVYGGWKSGATKLDPPSTAPNGSIAVDFQSSGLVLGGGVALPVNFGGAFSVTGGIGFMSGQDKEATKGGTTSTYTADSTIGVSLGLGYTYPINSNFGVSADIKYSSYNYTFNSGSSSEYTLQEKVSGVGLSMYAKF